MIDADAVRDRRRTLHGLLGGWPDPCLQELEFVDAAHWGISTPGPDWLTSTDSRSNEDQDCVIESLQLPCTRRNPGTDAYRMPALFCRPAGSEPCPVVLYCHAHGHNYQIGKRELLDGRPALPEGAYGKVLARRGIATLAIDLPCFGDRQIPDESSLTKALLWHGDTLFGLMLRELASALDYLQTRPDVDDSRMAAYGISMGATLSWWLAALDERVKAVAEVCCLADLDTLVELGAHDAHGIYMMVPGLLNRFRTADIASLVVPRAHLCAVGDRDPLTPPLAISRCADQLQHCYEQAGAITGWRLLVEQGSGHVETARMRHAVLDFLGEQLST